MLDLPPGPKGYPWLGVLPEMRKDPLTFLPRMVQEFGDVVRLGRFGMRQVFLVSDPSSLRHVLLEHGRKYGKGINFRPLKLLAPSGVAVLEGPAYLPRRRLVQPSFHNRQLPSFGPVMAECARDLVDRLATTPRGEPVDIGAAMMGLTLDIIVRTMFGSDVRAHTERITSAVNVLLEYISARMNEPLSLPPEVPTPANRQFMKARAVLDEVINGIIAARLKSGERPPDLLSLLLTARDPETGLQLSASDLHDEMVTAIIAGHETTANALTWTWLLLGQHPEVAAKLEEELDSVLQGRPPSHDDLPNLPYTRMVFCEAMRLYPPGWMMARTANEDDVLGQYRIPKGSLLFISPYVTHRRPDLWEQPEVFDPERFRDPAVEDHTRCRYIPFGAGPRMCIAKGFAMMEGPLVLATLAQALRLSLVPGRAVRPSPGFTLRPSDPVLVTVEQRAARLPARQDIPREARPQSTAGRCPFSGAQAATPAAVASDPPLPQETIP